MANSVFIFGPSCSGKSALGQALQKSMGPSWTYIDRDVLIESKTCMENNADATLERKIQEIGKRVIVNAQIPWRKKGQREFYCLRLPLLQTLLEGDANRAKVLHPPKKITLSNIDKTEFNLCLSSSGTSIHEEVKIIKSLINSKKKPRLWLENTRLIQEKFESRLNIMEPLFDDDKEYNYLFHISRGAPYGPYRLPLKKSQDDFSFYVVCFHYDFVKNLKFVFLQVPTRRLYQDYDKDVFEVKKEGTIYIYFSKNSKTLDVKLPEIAVDRVKISTTVDTPSDSHYYQELQIKQLAKLMSEKKTLFMTGAGVSYAEIPSYSPISTEIKKYTAQEVLLNPRIIFDRFDPWFERFFTAKPTLAHIAIRNICKTINCSVITGNFDMLQQKTGLIPFRIQGHIYPKYKEDFSKNSAKINLLFVVGASIDIRGQIANFRKSNKELKVIALLYDKKIPTYMKCITSIIFSD